MILVTGGTGLTGQFVVEELLRRGQAVRVLCRTDQAAQGVKGAEVALGELGDAESLRAAARDVSGIVHAACTYTANDTDAAAMRALIAEWKNGPFVYLSSLDVYGLAAGQLGAQLITENTPLSETFNEYAAGKVQCERLLAEAASQRGRSDYFMLRAPYIWGPHPNARKRLIPERLEKNLPLVLPGRDEAEWTQYQDVWIDARDLATLIAELLARPHSMSGGAFNVLTGHFAWHDLYEALIRFTGSKSELIHKPLDGITEEELPKKQLYAQRWRFSAARLKQQLGSLPHRSFEATVRDTVTLSR